MLWTSGASPPRVGTWLSSAEWLVLLTWPRSASIQRCCSSWGLVCALLADAVKVRTSHLTVQIISWMGFRSNLNRQKPRITRVGEIAIAQLLILHAEPTIATGREVSAAAGATGWAHRSLQAAVTAMAWTNNNGNSKRGSGYIFTLSFQLHLFCFPEPYCGPPLALCRKN